MDKLSLETEGFARQVVKLGLSIELRVLILLPCEMDKVSLSIELRVHIRTYSAEGTGFEPVNPLRDRVFETRAIDHYANPPI